MSSRNILVSVALLILLAFVLVRECRKESHKSPVKPKDSSGSSLPEESKEGQVDPNSRKNTSNPSSTSRSELKQQPLKPKSKPSSRQTIPQRVSKEKTPPSLPKTRKASKRTQAITKARKRLYGIPVATILPFSFVCKNPSIYSSWEYAKQNSDIPEQQEILNRILKQDKSCLTLPSGARGKLDRKGSSFLGEKEGIICLKGNSPSTSYCSHPNNVVR